MAETIFGGQEFDLTLADVAEIRQFHLHNLELEKTTDLEKATSLQRYAFKHSREALGLYERGEERIYELARYIYDFGTMCEQMALPVEDVAREVTKKVPEAMTLYELLRKRPWGYNLGQTITALAMMDRERDYFKQLHVNGEITDEELDEKLAQIH